MNAIQKLTLVHLFLSVPIPLEATNACAWRVIETSVEYALVSNYNTKLSFYILYLKWKNCCDSGLI